MTFTWNINTNVRSEIGEIFADENILFVSRTCWNEQDNSGITNDSYFLSCTSTTNMEEISTFHSTILKVFHNFIILFRNFLSLIQKEMCPQEPSLIYNTIQIQIIY